jgi:acyl-CoA reductase-like NAD-dependent aldehyde dehydrogenase
LLPIVAVPSVQDAITFVNDRPKPLALYVFTGSSTVADAVVAQTSSGGVSVNDTLLQQTNHNLPFGGVGGSGMGKGKRPRL